MALQQHPLPKPCPICLHCRCTGLTTAGLPCTPHHPRCLQTAAAICQALGLPSMHVSWAVSETLCRVPGTPTGPLVHWMWPRIPAGEQQQMQQQGQQDPAAGGEATSGGDDGSSSGAGGGGSSPGSLTAREYLTGLGATVLPQEGGAMEGTAPAAHAAGAGAPPHATPGLQTQAEFKAEAPAMLPGSRPCSCVLQVSSQAKLLKLVLVSVFQNEFTIPWLPLQRVSLCEVSLLKACAHLASHAGLQRGSPTAAGRPAAALRCRRRCASCCASRCAQHQQCHRWCQTRRCWCRRCSAGAGAEAARAGGGCG